MGVLLDNEEESELTLDELVAEMKTSVGTYEFTFDDVYRRYKQLGEKKIDELLREAVAKHLLLHKEGWYKITEPENIKVRKENRRL